MLAAALLGGVAASAAEPVADGERCLLEPTAARYVARAQDAMLERWALPEDVMANREVVVRLAFRRDGTLADLAVESASDRRLARSVIAAVLSAEPFGAVPASAACLVGLPIRTTFRNPAD